MTDPELYAADEQVRRAMEEEWMPEPPPPESGPGPTTAMELAEHLFVILLPAKWPGRLDCARKIADELVVRMRLEESWRQSA